MNSSIFARSGVATAAFLLGGLLSGCSAPEAPPTATDAPIERGSQPSSTPMGAPAAKGRELRAVATVRAWISARNRALATRDRSAVITRAVTTCGTCDRYLRGGWWRVESARVTRHTVESATVAVAIVTSSSGRMHLSFEVARVDGTARVTKIAVLP